MVNEADKAGKQPASPLDGRLARWPLHPYLLCYFAVASFLAPNVAVVPPFKALPLLATVLLGSLAIHLVLRFALRRRAAVAALGTLALAFVFLFEPQFRGLFASLPGASWRLPLGPLAMSLGKFLALGLCAALPVLAVLLGWRLREKPRRALTLCLNLLLLGLFLSSTAAVLLGWQRALANAAPPPDFTPRDARGIAPGQYPDIIHVILDAYARDDVYQKLTGETNAPMTELLGQWNFQIPRSPTSNYPMTHGSMFCLMNFAYPQGEGVLLQGRAFRDCAAFRQLRHLGYRIELKSYVGMADPQAGNLFRGAFADEFQHRSLWGSIREVLYRQGILDIRRKGVFYRRQFERAMAHLASLEEDGQQPLYFQAHVVGTHPPFVYDAEGNPIYVTDLVAEQELHRDPERNHALGKAAFAEYGTFYAGQARHTRRILEQALAGFLARKRSRPCVVIVQSDHGPGLFLLPFHPEQDKLPYCFANYMAVHASPPLRVALPDTVTPVNLFPLLFNQVFGTAIPLREERHVLTGWGREESDYTAEVQKALRPVSPRRHEDHEEEN